MKNEIFGKICIVLLLYKPCRFGYKYAGQVRIFDRVVQTCMSLWHYGKKTSRMHNQSKTYGLEFRHVFPQISEGVGLLHHQLLVGGGALLQSHDHVVVLLLQAVRFDEIFLENPYAFLVIGNLQINEVNEYCVPHGEREIERERESSERKKNKEERETASASSYRLRNFALRQANGNAFLDLLDRKGRVWRGGEEQLYDVWKVNRSSTQIHA